jgi:C1A family cysteine protease
MPKPVNPVYGWIPQPADENDLQFSIAKPLKGLPASVDLRGPFMPPIWDQRQLGSCTAHGIGRLFEYAQRQAGIADFSPSRLFLYYNERVLEGTISEDSGAQIRDGIKTLNHFNYGICEEALWPYDISKFTETPPQAAYDAAKKNTIRYFASLDGLTIDHLKQCLFHGFPFTFGFNVYQNFEDYTGGVLQLPTRGRCLGGHCAATVGYDDSKEAFLVANSWGPEFGEDGYFWMSYDYMMSDLVSDKWMMRLR